ncbi:MAG: glycoside hydrolase family 9 protein [Vampirovibrionia bacterium]
MKKILLCLLFIALNTISTECIAEQIYVNQLGYYPDCTKYALIENPTGNSTAEIINSATNETILTASLSNIQTDKFSNTRIGKVDFTSITTPGKYYVKYNGFNSFIFDIGNDIYKDALFQTARSYYLQSCGKEINDYISGMIHPPCHLKDGAIKRGDAYNFTGKIINSIGGWHDAGDYGKYITSSSTASTLLMLAFEMYPNTLGLNLSIQKENNLPDILSEVKYALEWMLRMQREDGAVYRKCSGEKWPSDTTLAQNDTQERFVYGISSQDTGRFTATMAIAYRVFKPYDKIFADKCLNASLKSWKFLTTHPYTLDYKNTDDSGSGGYPNPSYDTEPYAYTDIDEKIWAAAELYLSTGNLQYLTTVTNNLNQIHYEPFSWKNETYMAVFELATHNNSDPEIKKQMESKLILNANAIIQKMSDNPYSIPMDKFKWGSNANILGEGITLTYAYKVTKDPIYKKYAEKTLNYIFGINPMNKSYVSMMGSNPANNIHHRYSMATGKIIPGLLAGGPNDTANDNVAKPGLKIKSYIDNAHSYATNEYAIDYNAPLVFMLTWAVANK